VQKIHPRGKSEDPNFCDDVNLICLEFRDDFTLILHFLQISVNEFPILSDSVMQILAFKNSVRKMFTPFEVNRLFSVNQQ